MTMHEPATGAEIAARYRLARKRMMDAGLRYERRAKAAESRSAEPERPPLYSQRIGPVCRRQAILTLDEHVPRYVALRDILKAAADEFHFSVPTVTGPRRTRGPVDARFVYYHVAQALTPHSVVRIGRVCGGRDHATVINGLARVEKRIAYFGPLIARVMARLTEESVSTKSIRARSDNIPP